MSEELVVTDPTEVGQLTTEPDQVKIVPINDELRAQREAFREQLK